MRRVFMILLIFMLPLLGCEPEESPWLMEKIEAECCGAGDWDQCGADVTAIACDESGALHVIYGGIKHASRADGQWESEIINEDEDVLSLGVVFDGDDLHLWYGGRYGLRYVDESVVGFRVELVSEISILSSAMVVDSGIPHIIYYDITGKLVHVWKAGAAWQEEVIEETSIAVLSWTDVAVDTQGKLHVVYARDGTIMYAIRAEDGWLPEKVTDMDEEFITAGVDVDSNDAPHIIYTTYLSTDMFYARKDNDNWKIEAVEIESRYAIASNSVLRIDPSDNVHVCFITDLGTTHGYRDEDGWHMEAIDLGFVYGLDFVLTPDGRPQMSGIFSEGSGLYRELYYGYLYERRK